MNNKYIYLAACAAVTVLSGCSNELEEAASSPVSTGKSVTLQANFGASTRLAITDEGKNGISFKWEDSDYLQVFSSNSKQFTQFSLTEGEGTNAGIFKGTPVNDFKPGETLYTLFSKNSNCPVAYNAERGGAYIDLSGQDGNLNEKYQYMFGQTEYKEGATSLTLKHIVTALKVNVTLPSEVTEAQSIVFLDQYGKYVSNGYVMLQDGTFGTSDYKAGDVIRKGATFQEVQMPDGGYYAQQVEYPDPSETGINLNGSFAVSNNQLTKYFYVMKTSGTSVYESEHAWNYIENYSSMSPLILVKANSRYYTASARDGREIEAGAVYELNLEAKASEVIKENTPTKIDYYNEDEGSYNYYSFTPEKTGYYYLGYNFEIMSGSYERDNNGLFKLTAGEPLLIRFYQDTEVTFSPALIEGENVITTSFGDHFNYYAFTPSTTDWYSVKGLQDDDELYFKNNNPTQYRNAAYLEAGVTYFLIIYHWGGGDEEERTISISKASELAVNTEVEAKAGDCFKLQTKVGSIITVEGAGDLNAQYLDARNLNMLNGYVLSVVDNPLLVATADGKLKANLYEPIDGGTISLGTTEVTAGYKYSFKVEKDANYKIRFKEGCILYRNGEMYDWQINNRMTYWNKWLQAGEYTIFLTKSFFIELNMVK